MIRTIPLCILLQMIRGCSCQGKKKRSLHIISRSEPANDQSLSIFISFSLDPKGADAVIYFMTTEMNS